MSVAVIVPYRDGCEHRARAWDWLRARYAAEHPGWELLDAAGADPWVKAAAVMPAIAACHADVVIVADADVWCDELASAVDEVQAGWAWAVPHRGVHRLTDTGTAALLAGALWEQQPLSERAYLGLLGGGIVIGHRDLLLSVPLDPRFVGWGQEDESWGLALATLLGPPHRGRGPLVHLWHPPQPRLTRRVGSDTGRRLRDRYVLANGDPNVMRALLNEIEETACPTLSPAGR